MNIIIIIFFWIILIYYWDAHYNLYIPPTIFMWWVQEREAENEWESLKIKADGNIIQISPQRTTQHAQSRSRVDPSELKLVVARKWRRTEKKDGTFGGWESWIHSRKHQSEGFWWRYGEVLTKMIQGHFCLSDMATLLLSHVFGPLP